MNTDFLLRALLILLTVSLVSVGQVLFKYVSMLISANNSLWSIKIIFYTLLSFFVSGSGSLIYIALLRKISLSNAYPVMALSFLLVPLLSFFIYGDKLNLPYFIGIALIIAGIIIATQNV